ncbi:MAG: hypothetical protein U0441_09575 [Polyangiaceae bacterium]
MAGISEDDFDPYEGCELLRALVEEAIAPFGDLAAEDVEDLRDFLIVHTTTHPAIAPLYTRMKRRTVNGRSGVAGGATTEEDALRNAVRTVAGTRRGGAR